VTGGQRRPRRRAPGEPRPRKALGSRGSDERSGLATFLAGTFGPEIEAVLGARGFTLGHFPILRAFDARRLIATAPRARVSGLRRIERLVAGSMSPLPRESW
jgi:hypothetical protein